MEELEQLKSRWKELNRRVEVLEKENRDKARIIIDMRCKTSRDRLLSYYRRFIAMALLCVVMFPLLFLRSGVLNDGWALPTVIYFDIYFIICACMDLWLYHKVSALDVYRDSLSTISRNAMSVRKRHQLFVLILIPMAIVGILLLVLGIGESEAILPGLVLGGIVGCFIGISKYRKMMRSYRDLESNFEVTQSSKIE